MADNQTLPTRPIGKVGLKISYWLVTHRILLKRALVVFLALLSVGLYSYTLMLVISLARGREAHQAMMAQLTQDYIDYAGVRAAQQPKPISISSPQALPAGADLVDYVVTVSNSNDKYAVPSLRVTFFAGGSEVASTTSFLLPGETKYMFGFGAARSGGQAGAAVSDVQWSRVRLAEFTELRHSHLRAVIEDVRHSPASEIGTPPQQLGGVTKFTVRNDSIYGYWQVGLYVLLKNGGQVVAAQHAKAERIAPQQRQSVSVSWPQALPLFTEIEVVPEINLFDAGVFYDYRATWSEPK